VPYSDSATFQHLGFQRWGFATLAPAIRQGLPTDGHSQRVGLNAAFDRTTDFRPPFVQLVRDRREIAVRFELIVAAGLRMVGASSVSDGLLQAAEVLAHLPT
jgi:hypothetical protein